MRYPSPKGFIGGPWVFVRYPPTGYTLTHVDAEVYMVSKGVCEEQLYPAQDMFVQARRLVVVTHFTRKIGGGGGHSCKIGYASLEVLTYGRSNIGFQ